MRGAGNLSSRYIDDSYLQGDAMARQRCWHHNNVCAFRVLCTPWKIGICAILEIGISRLWPIHDSHVHRSQTRKKKFASCNSLLQKTTPTTRQVAVDMGILVSNFPGSEYDPLHYRHLKGDKYIVSCQKGWFFEYYAVISTVVVVSTQLRCLNGRIRALKSHGISRFWSCDRIE